MPAKIELIFKSEWKKLKSDAIIRGIPKELTNTSKKIATQWRKQLRQNAPVFTGLLQSSIELRKGAEGRGKGVVTGKYFITVTAPHALELVEGPIRARWVHRDSRSYGGRTFGEWMNERGLPPFRGLIVGFEGTTMFGKYKELWWDKTNNQMISFINEEFPKLVNKVEKLVQKV